jgi:transposase InsO family protein
MNDFYTITLVSYNYDKVKSLADLIRTIDEYIYLNNHERIKLTLGGYSPIQYRLMNR